MHTPTMYKSVEYVTEAGGINGPAMHAKTDDATRELVRDHEHPVLSNNSIAQSQTLRSLFR